MATDSLEKSIFYRSLVTEHMGLFQEAGNNCWSICIPHNSSVRDVLRMDVLFMKAHILKPSPLLRNHYIPANNTYIEDIEIKSDSLLVRERQLTPSSSSTVVIVKILGSEDAYNEKNKLYRIILIDRALTSKHLKEPIAELSLNVQDVVTLEDCRKYLDSISASVRQETEAKAVNLKETMSGNNIIDLNEVQDALNTIFDWSRSRFLKPNPSQTASPVLLAAQEDQSILDYSIESLLLFPFHDQLLRSIEVTNKEDSSRLMSQASLMKNKRLDMSSLGTEQDLDAFYPSLEAIDLLACLPLQKTPMEKMMTFKSVLNLIREDLISCLEAAHSPFDCKPMKTLVPDDLVAATIYSVIQSQIGDVIMNNLSFIQTLGTKLPVMNELAYSLVTFEVALAFIKNYKSEEETQQKSSPVKSQNKQLPSITTPPDHRDRTSSFSCFRSRDSRFDKQLEQLSRMVEDLSTEHIEVAAVVEEQQLHSDPESDKEVDDKRKNGQDFLTTLQQSSLYGMSYGRLD